MSFRILQVAGGLPRWGGTEKYVLETSSALADRGHAITLACPDGSLLAERADDLGLQRIGLETHTTCDWKQLAGLIRAFAGNYDVVHIHSPLDYVIPALAARIARIPAIVMTRHLAYPFASRRRAYICTALLYHRIIAVSDFVHTLLVDSGAPTRRLALVRNGIVPVELDPGAGLRLREELNIPRDAILVAAAGRMSTGKGFDVLLRAVHRLNAGGISVYCAIFGAGALLERLRSLAVDLKIDAQVRLPGFHSDIHDLWCAADVAVIPSIEAESFSYTTIEALSAGCPVVASCIGALPEVVSPDCAILTEPGDVKAIADAICDLASSPELRGRMNRAARQRANLFSLDGNVAAVERTYSDLLNPEGQFRAKSRYKAKGMI